MRCCATLLAGAALLLGGCDRRGDAGPVVVDAIGRNGGATGGDLRDMEMPTALLRDATAQGLVRFDATGQIEPGLAERWIVIDGGQSYIFRLRDATWGDGAVVTSAQVVTILQRAVALRSHSRLLPFLSAIGEIVAMTPEVIEVRLRHPRPDLLKLFAQPEMALVRVNPTFAGSGPFRIAQRDATSWRLVPALDPNRDPDDPVEPTASEDEVRLIGETAARAVTRFGDHDSDLVSGGTFADWPLVPMAHIAPANIRIDPAAGLFGLAIVSREGFLADLAARSAIAQAIDRDAIVAAFASGWPSAVNLLPEQLDAAAAPATPSWLAPNAVPPREIVAAWQRQHPGPVTLRLALPAGPGATILHGLVASQLRGIGIEVLRVGADDAAELRLVDAVAPYDSARWYLATACQPCSEAATTAVENARNAMTMALRAQQIALADRLLAADVAFIPIARPLRWSLVSRRLRQWQPNPRAWHPLNHLRDDPTS